MTAVAIDIFQTDFDIHCSSERLNILAFVTERVGNDKQIWFADPRKAIYGKRFGGRRSVRGKKIPLEVWESKPEMGDLLVLNYHIQNGKIMTTNAKTQNNGYLYMRIPEFFNYFTFEEGFRLEVDISEVLEVNLPPFKFKTEEDRAKAAPLWLKDGTNITNAAFPELSIAAAACAHSFFLVKISADRSFEGMLCISEL